MEMQSQGAGTGEATLWAARVGLGLALIGLIMEVASGWGYRHGWWGLRVALRYLFAYGGVVAIVACVVSLVVLALAIGTKSRGAALALLGVVAGAVPGVLFYRQYRVARSVPPINDVATDLTTPPGYVTAATNDFWKGKDMSYPAGFADSVRRGYPDLGSLVLPVPAAKAYGLAHATAMGMSGWEVTGRDSAGGGGGGGGGPHRGDGYDRLVRLQGRRGDPGDTARGGQRGGGHALQVARGEERRRGERGAHPGLLRRAQAGSALATASPLRLLQLRRFPVHQGLRPAEKVEQEGQLRVAVLGKSLGRGAGERLEQRRRPAHDRRMVDQVHHDPPPVVRVALAPDPPRNPPGDPRQETR